MVLAKCVEKYILRIMINYKAIKKRYLSTKDLPYTCMYCGEPADQREHVYPRSLFGEDTPKVWACAECNQIAGAKLFESIEEKRDFIIKRLERKYRSILSIPDWAEDEIEELEGNMRQAVKQIVEANKWIKQRLAWRTSPVALVVAKRLQERDTGKDFAPLTVALNITQRREAQRLISYDNYEQMLAMHI